MCRYLMMYCDAAVLSCIFFNEMSLLLDAGCIFLYAKGGAGAGDDVYFLSLYESSNNERLH